MWLFTVIGTTIPSGSRIMRRSTRTIGFKTKLCKPRRSFTNGKVERLVRFVKENFLVGRTFFNVNDWNCQTLEWCDKQNNVFRRAVFGVRRIWHFSICAERVHVIKHTFSLGD